jgi:hypothetical protein
VVDAHLLVFLRIQRLIMRNVVAPLSIPIGVKNAPSFTFRAALRKRTSEASPLI